jgi:SAM-dependent methyltransferase
MRRFAADFGVTAATTVLDVGGTPFNWSLLDELPQLVMLNLRAPEARGATVRYVLGDGRALPFRAGAFDIAFSNSVIEHVGTPRDQAQFARETARVGRRYFVQAPNRWFPFEPHLLGLCVHWLPLRWRRRLVRTSVVGLLWPVRARYLVDQVRLPTAREMRAWFPGGTVRAERFLALRKALIAVR